MKFENLGELVKKRLNEIPRVYNLTKDNITPEDIIDKLLEWNRINETLIAYDVSAKVKWQEAKNNLDIFMAVKTTEARDELTNDTKKISSIELEKRIIRDNREEWEDLHDKMIEAEYTVAYWRRCLDSWERYHWTLRSCIELLKMENYCGGYSGNLAAV